MQAGTRGLVRRFSRVFLLALAATAALALANASAASAQGTLAASCEPPREFGHVISGDDFFAQTFTPQLSGSLVQADLDVSKEETEGDYVVEIRATDASGEPTDEVLASATVPDEDVPDGPPSVIISAVFADPATVVAGELYAVSATRPGSSELNLGGRDDTACPHTAWFSSDGGSSWTGQDSDMVFRVFVTPPAQLTCQGEPATIVASPGDEVTLGTPDRDVIVGFAGADVILSFGGKDLICARRGADFANGGKGRDRIFGQEGPDFLNGRGGRDRLFGGKGSDFLLKGGKKADVLRGGGKRDGLRGGGGADRLFGGKGNDSCKGGVGNDTLLGC
jgi:Ca2+-binding RTX toxin-like protein